MNSLHFNLKDVLIREIQKQKSLHQILIDCQKKKHRGDNVIIREKNGIPSLLSKGLKNRNSRKNNSKAVTKIDLIKNKNLLSYTPLNLVSHQIVPDLSNLRNKGPSFDPTSSSVYWYAYK